MVVLYEDTNGFYSAEQIAALKDRYGYYDTISHILVSKQDGLPVGLATGAISKEQYEALVQIRDKISDPALKEKVSRLVENIESTREGPATDPNSFFYYQLKPEGKEALTSLIKAIEVDQSIDPTTKQPIDGTLRNLGVFSRTESAKNILKFEEDLTKAGLTLVERGNVTLTKAGRSTKIDQFITVADKEGKETRFYIDPEKQQITHQYVGGDDGKFLHNGKYTAIIPPIAFDPQNPVAESLVKANNNRAQVAETLRTLGTAATNVAAAAAPFIPGMAGTLVQAATQTPQQAAAQDAQDAQDAEAAKKAAETQKAAQPEGPSGIFAFLMIFVTQVLLPMFMGAVKPTPEATTPQQPSATAPQNSSPDQAAAPQPATPSATLTEAEKKLLSDIIDTNINTNKEANSSGKQEITIPEVTAFREKLNTGNLTLPPGITEDKIMGLLEKFDTTKVEGGYLRVGGTTVQGKDGALRSGELESLLRELGGNMILAPGTATVIDLARGASLKKPERSGASR